MKKLLPTICCMLLVCACEAQTRRVWMKDGSERQFAVSEVDSVTFSKEGTSMEQRKKEIEQFLDDWNAAMIAADTARLGSMMKYHKIEKRDVVVTSNDNGSASVSFTPVITATIWGSYGTWTLSGTMRLVKRSGRWIRVE